MAHNFLFWHSFAAHFLSVCIVLLAATEHPLYSEMAEQQVVDQFKFWNENLTESIHQEVQNALKLDPLNLPTLQDAYNGMHIDLEKVQLYQPNPKTKVMYSYKDALPNIARALRLEQKVKPMLTPQNETSNTGSTPQTTNVIAMEYNAKY